MSRSGLTSLAGLAHLPPSVRDVLGEGEVPLAWESVALWGEDRSGGSEPPGVAQSNDLHPLSLLDGGPLDVDPRFVDRWLGGTAVTGHAGSFAESLGHVLRVAGKPRCAVTSERIMIFSEGKTTFGVDPFSGGKTWDVATVVLWSISLVAVRTATRRSRAFMAGRLVVEFADSSTVALMCGVFSPWAANRIRHAVLLD